MRSPIEVKAPNRTRSLFRYFFVTMALLCLAGALAWIGFDGSQLHRLEAVAISIGVVLMLVYTYVLYFGVLFDAGESLWSAPDQKGLFGLWWTSIFDLNGGFFPPLGSGGIFNFGLGLVLDAFVCSVLGILLSALIWLGVNTLILGLVLFCCPLFYLFKRSLNSLALHRTRCQGNLLPALWTAARYALGKTAVALLVIVGAHRLAMFLVGV